MEADTFIIVGEHFQFDPNQKQIGQGFFGKVFKGQRRKDTVGEQNGMPDIVAVKVLIRYQIGQMTKEDMQAFTKQAEAMRELVSPGVVAIYDWSIVNYEKKRRFAIAMQLMEGTLQNILKDQWKGKPIPEDKATSLLYDIVQAYRWIYEKSEIKKANFKESGDIIHRDLKPENILYKRNEQGKLIFKIGDFRSIRNYKIKRTKMTRNVGTRDYQAPQQMKIKNPEYTNKADVYAIGVIFFELLNGWEKFPTQMPDPENDIYCVDPLDKTPDEQCLKKVLKRGNVSDKAIEFIIKCLKKEEKDRYGWTDVFQHQIFKKLQEIRNQNARKDKIPLENSQLADMGYEELDRQGKINYDNGNNSQALKFYNRALEIYERNYAKDSIDCAVTLNNIGNVYDNQGNNSQALKFYNRALEIYERNYAKDSIDCAVTLNNIGLVYDNQGNNSQALKFYNRALEIFERNKGKDSINCAVTLNNIGSVYKNQGNNSQALKFYNGSLEIKERVKGKDSIDCAVTLHNIGSVYEKQGNYSQALKFFNRSAEIK